MVYANPAHKTATIASPLSTATNVRMDTIWITTLECAPGTVLKNTTLILSVVLVSNALKDASGVQLTISAQNVRINISSTTATASCPVLCRLTPAI